ncbi:MULTISPECIES: hypothetical protein [unclassified Pseudomonas]|uniref:hypothetical protein n=1 Tax=unclassified Pseudomonas TaxID=196821 RepID=UPI00244B6ACC|nr:MULTISPECIES: hypothetical protein [unclassified Pseudomonas]MDG9930272.1 hypothetical protein [Pseudomonas sp. GD04042]MDH0484727.1 hypothetical protein [Pseudomonas sp. GD04015]MDH0605806.1 hypothetical protein [Pseudomonas sp. GD03869]
MKRGEAIPPPTLGEGCLQRYDPEALSETDGTEFPGAAELWRRLRQVAEEEGAAQDLPAPDEA